jgi:hypothetical protein
VSAAPARLYPRYPRRVAVCLWAAMLVLLGLFLALVLALPRPGPSAAPRDLFFWMAVATSALGIALSRTMPQRIGAPQAGGRPEALAFTRCLVGWALCEGVAIFPLVANLLQPDARLLGVFAVDALALLVLFPTRDRWAELAELPEKARAPGRTAV